MNQKCSRVLWTVSTWEHGCLMESATILGSLIRVYQQFPFTALQIIRCRKLLRGICFAVNVLDWIPQPYEIFLSQTPLLYLHRWKGYFFQLNFYRFTNSAFAFKAPWVTCDNKMLFHTGICPGSSNRLLSPFVTCVGLSKNVLWICSRSSHHVQNTVFLTKNKQIQWERVLFSILKKHSDFNSIYPRRFLSSFQSIIDGSLQKKKKHFFNTSGLFICIYYVN